MAVRPIQAQKMVADNNKLTSQSLRNDRVKSKKTQKRVNNRKPAQENHQVVRQVLKDLCKLPVSKQKEQQSIKFVASTDGLPVPTGMFKSFMARGMHTMLNQPFLAFPDRIEVELKYMDIFNISSFATNTVLNANYAANSCYDPDQVLTGHQPAGFDQWAAFYNKHIVTHCDMEVWIINTSASGAAHFTLVPRAVGTAISTSLTYIIPEQPYAKFFIVGEAEGKALAHEHYHFDLPKFTGLSMTQYLAEENYWEGNSAIPTDPIYLQMYGSEILAGGAYNVHILLKQRVTFFERSALPTS